MKRMWSKNELKEIVKGTQGYNFANLVDKDGHSRFIEGDGSPKTISGITINYCKWSLSGSHLLLVCAGNVDASTVITTDEFASFVVPEWVYNKLSPMTSKYLDFKTVSITSNGYQASTSISAVLTKEDDKLHIIVLSKSFDAVDMFFRISFDMLIDND